MPQPSMRRRSFIKLLGLATAASASVKRLAAAELIRHGAEDLTKAQKISYERIRKKLSANKGLRIENARAQKGAAKTIILMDDVHGVWKPNFEALEAIRHALHVNAVAVEGWAGHEVDKKRGFRLLNAETELIEVILPNQRYKVIGLEDKRLQEITLKEFMYRLHIISEHWKAVLDSPQGRRSRIRRSMEILQRASQEAAENLSKRLQISLLAENLEKIKGELASHFGSIYTSFDQIRAWDAKEGEKALDDRSRYAASKLLKEMDERNIGCAVMLFGKAHVPVIMGELKKSKKVNVIHIHALEDFMQFK